ncbi:MAG: hypothetical protein ABI461_15155 [Polyangiaceae bacterium]
MGAPFVWSSTAGQKPERWLWNAKTDLLLIGGGLYFVFAAVAIPAAFIFAGLSAALVTVFLHAGLIVNQPHYAATFHIAIKERATQPRIFKWLLASLVVMVPVTILSVHWVDIALSPITRIYLTWSAWHYSAQHFGISAMYSARNKRPLLPAEKFPLQVAFVGVAVFMMLSINLIDPASAASFGATGAKALASTVRQPWAYPLGLFIVVVSMAAAITSHVRLKKRTGKGLEIIAWMLLGTNFFWFVIPNVLLGTNNLWGRPEIALWFPFALPFFHCIQYLGVTCHRTRSAGDVRPVYLLILLMAMGALIFEGYAWSISTVAGVNGDKALALVMALVNIHHFWLDGMMWKRPKGKAAAPVAAIATTPEKAQLTPGVTS